MAREIELWFQDRQPEDLVLLFFSGHGVKDDRRDLYFAAANTEKQRDRLLTSTATPARFIHDCIRSCKAKYLVLILDCCFSGAFGEWVARDDGEIPLKEQLGAEGRVVLTSTSAVDYSFEEKGADLSIYTRYLVEGIATGAADEDEDGVITVDELHRYAGRKVKETSPAMTPTLITLKDEGFRIRVARSPQADPRLKYRKEVERRATAAKFTPPAKRILMALRAELGLADEEAEAIEAEILKPHREYQRKQQEYQETLRQCLERESPLSSRTIDDLRDYRAHLQLKPEDVTSIEQAALNGKTLEGYVAELERQWQAQAQQQAEAERQQREAKAERKRQAQAQHQRQEEKARYSKPQPSTVLPSAPPSPPRPITGGTLMSRQQFLKWGGLSSVGLIVAFWISQALRDSPSSSTVTVNPTTSVNPPVENIPASQVDYGQLKALLKAGQWQKADEETRKVMLKIAGRESKGWLDTASIKNFPCGALGTIDQLWVEASG